MLLQASLCLFFLGLAIFLIDLDATIGWSITPFIILWASLFFGTLFAPAIFAHCPYHTPLFKRLLHSCRYSIHRATANIYVFTHPSYARYSQQTQPTQPHWAWIKLKTVVWRAWRIFSYYIKYWGTWLYWTICTMPLGHSSRLYLYEKEYQFVDERSTRTSNVMDPTCLSRIDANFMDDEYLEYLLDCIGHIDLRSTVSFVRSIVQHRDNLGPYPYLTAAHAVLPNDSTLSADSWFKLRSVILDRFIQHLDCMQNECSLRSPFPSQTPYYEALVFVSSREFVQREPDVVALFHRLLHLNSYGALLVVSALAEKLLLANVLDKIEIQSLGATENFMQAVWELSNSLIKYHTNIHRETVVIYPPEHPVNEDAYMGVLPLCLCYVTFHILVRTDERLITPHSDGLIAMQAALFEAVQLEGERHSPSLEGDLYYRWKVWYTKFVVIWDHSCIYVTYTIPELSRPRLDDLLNYLSSMQYEATTARAAKACCFVKILPD
ncbi:hypothetical protein ABKN59_009702 [Abortiporus biennis]